MAKKIENTLTPDLQKAEKQFEAYDQNIKEMTMDRLNEAPKQDMEPQTKLSSSQIEKSKDIYLKPTTSIGSREKFNEKFRESYNYDKELVHFIAENKEIIGEMIEMWTKPYPGMPAEYWKIPTNKPVWGPRYVAEQIKSKFYHRLIMQQTVTENSGAGQFYGQLAADTTIQRLDAIPVSSRKSVFMGAKGF